MKTWPIIVSKGYPGGWGDESVQAETTISPESPPTTESGAEYKYTEVAQRNTKEEEIMSSLNSFIVEFLSLQLGETGHFREFYSTHTDAWKNKTKNTF